MHEGSSQDSVEGFSPLKIADKHVLHYGRPTKGDRKLAGYGVDERDHGWKFEGSK